MLRNRWTLLGKRWPSTTRVLILPLLLLCVVGFFINSYLSVLSTYDVCYPKTNIVFLKTHKCAGSSVQNILMRYGDVHKLTFVLPKKGNYMGHPAPFSRTMVEAPRLPSYNILAHHTRLDYREIRSLMPGNSVYVTIVRDPIEVFESAYSYYGFQRHLGGNLHTFTAKIPAMDAEKLHKRLKFKFGSNQMMFDLGADPGIFNNESLIRQYVDKLESWFDLVMIADRMDESLVLLRNLMCWNLDDVVTFKLNARDPKFKSNLDADEKTVLRQLNNADVILYNRSLEVFEKAIDHFGRDRMAVETEQLREKTRKWHDLCIKGAQLPVKASVKPKYYSNPKVMVFEANAGNNSTCRSMTTEELPYTDILRQKQKARFRSFSSSSIRRRVVSSNSSKAKVITK